MITPVEPLFANYQDDGVERIQRQLDEIARKLSGADVGNAQRMELSKQQKLLQKDLTEVVPRFIKSLPIQAIAQVNNQFIMLVLHDNKIIPAPNAATPETGMVLHSIDTVDATKATRPVTFRPPYAKDVVTMPLNEAPPEVQEAAKADTKKPKLLKKD